jgi:23S rRNA (adenine1618-N6)-methyltransferase
LPQKSQSTSAEKSGLHARNRHRSRYDFKQLVKSHPELARFVARNQYGDESIDFANPEAVKTLNRALLKHFYGITHWDIPENYLCPPIPGRADYLHHIADLLKSSNKSVIPRGKSIRVLDIGVGANCIYPIIGHKEYGWYFVGSDTDPTAIRSAKHIVKSNTALAGAIECRLQPTASDIFTGIIKSTDVFDLTVCNPPFHASLAEAREGTHRKWKNLGFKKRSKPVLNFGGQNAELWCKGGEERFVRTMIEQSTSIPDKCFWFSTLVAKSAHLPAIYHALKAANAADVRTIGMAQGQKIGRIVAWTFLTKAQQVEWRTQRWSKSP